MDNSIVAETIVQHSSVGRGFLYHTGVATQLGFLFATIRQKKAQTWGSFLLALENISNHYTVKY